MTTDPKPAAPTAQAVTVTATGAPPAVAAPGPVTARTFTVTGTRGPSTVVALTAAAAVEQYRRHYGLAEDVPLTVRPEQ